MVVRKKETGACQSMEEEVVVYIHHGAALLPILLTLMRRETSHYTHLMSHACLAHAWRLA